MVKVSAAPICPFWRYSKIYLGRSAKNDEILLNLLVTHNTLKWDTICLFIVSVSCVMLLTFKYEEACLKYRPAKNIGLLKKSRKKNLAKK